MKIENIILSRREFHKAAATSCVTCGLMFGGAAVALASKDTSSGASSSGDRNQKLGITEEEDDGE